MCRRVKEWLVTMQIVFVTWPRGWALSSVHPVWVTATGSDLATRMDIIRFYECLLSCLASDRMGSHDGLWSAVAVSGLFVLSNERGPDKILCSHWLIVVTGRQTQVPWKPSIKIGHFTQTVFIWSSFCVQTWGCLYVDSNAQNQVQLSDSHWCLVMFQ